MARLNFADYKSHVRHALGGGDPNAEFTSADVTKGHIVNQAGRYLYSMHEWSFKKKPPQVDLTIAANQTFLRCPYTFDGLDAVIVSSPQDGRVRLVDLSVLESMRATDDGNVLFYYAAISYPQSTDLKSGQPKPQIEFYPTPTSSTGIRLVYRAGWVELLDDDAVPVIPEKLDWLLLQLVDVFAKVQDKHDVGMAMLENLLRGTPLADLKANDGMGMAAPRMPSGGHVQYPIPRYWEPRTTTVSYG